MKFREDFVTNSSSASYIICFARVADMDKAKPIIDKYKLDLLDANDVKHEMRWGELGADWAGACLYGTDKILEAYPDDKYIIIEDYIDAYYEDEKKISFLLTCRGAPCILFGFFFGCCCFFNFSVFSFILNKFLV